METKKLYFDASQIIDFKPILKKEFLELKMRAISTANPNRNKSWFTKESLKRAKETFVNKPILGYFENGDFVSHNGEWKQDTETGLDYWDTYGKKGERILGFIRKEDDIEIVEDENGLSWICFSCALWVQYNFKQVQRLLKDAVRAKKTGGATKNISVEVDITDWEELDNGVTKINDFNLIGVTILGSRNGVKVEPGIEDAELSVVDIAGKELYEKQANTLRLIYEKKLDDSAKQNKEDFSKVENAQVKTTEENIATATVTDNTATEPTNVQMAATDDTATADAATAAATNGEDTTTVDNTAANTNDQFNAQGTGDDVSTSTDSTATTSTQDEGAQSAENFEKDKVCEKCGKNPCECEKKHEKESCDCIDGDDKPKTKEETIRDLAWLVSDMSWNIVRFDDSIKYYEEHEEAIGRNYILPILRRLRNQNADNEKELAEVLAKIATDFEDNAENNQYEEKLAEHYNVRTLYKDYCDLLAEKENLENSIKEKDEKINSFEKGQFLSSAKNFIEAAQLSEEDTKSFYASCESGEIGSLEDLKIKVAVKVFDARQNAPKAEPQTSTESFTAPVQNVDTKTAFAGKDKESKDLWSRIKAATND